MIQIGLNKHKDEDGLSLAGSLIILFSQMACLYPVIVMRFKLENQTHHSNHLGRNASIERHVPPSYESLYGANFNSNFDLPPAYNVVDSEVDQPPPRFE